MTTITNADELRNKVNLEKELAKNYGVQQNLLISLKNLNNNPPYLDFDIGLPPYNHQSSLWDYELEKSSLYDLSNHLEMDYIENNEIKPHVFRRMYEGQMAIEILAETIFQLIKRGFGIKITHFLGINFQIEREGDDMLQSQEVQQIFEDILLSVNRDDPRANELFLRKFAELANHMIASDEHELSKDLDLRADYDADFERCVHPRNIGFLPNIGLRISFD